MPQQRDRVVAVDGIAGDADAGIHPKRAVVQREGWIQAGAQPVGHSLSCCDVAAAGQHHYKLTAPDARHPVALPQPLRQPLRHLAQQTVAGVVAASVVDVLEAVQIRVKHITLPNEMAELVRFKVAAGEYATESEVILDGLRTLAARDKAVDAWLCDQVVRAAKALKADPSRGLLVGQVREHLTWKRSARRGSTAA